MKKALVVGINYYENDNVDLLYGCVNDAHSVKAMLDRHADGAVNFGVKLLVGTSQQQLVSRKELRNAIEELFVDECEIALLYFAGHGYIESTGGYLCPSDCDSGNDGIPLSDIITFANNSPARNKIVILDSCHSGAAGTSPISAISELSEGLTILTASTASQYANEEDGSGIFTSLLVDALGGAASNLVGDITPGAIYAHIDQSLGPWTQRPVFKTNVKSFVSLRKVQPELQLSDLRKIAELFPEPGFEFNLDLSFEPERNETQELEYKSFPPDPHNTEIFSILQKYYRVNLIIPNNAPHMWHAAVQSKSCSLTVLGEHYRRLVSSGLI